MHVEQPLKQRAHICRIHLFGASGSGTTTLGQELAARRKCLHLDSDDYYWEQTDPSYLSARPREERLRLITPILESHDEWVLSGSMCGWGDPLRAMFDVAVLISVDNEERMRRLKLREHQRYGQTIFLPEHEGHQRHQAFLAWAASYETGGLDIRSRVVHEAWAGELSCPLIRLSNNGAVADSTSALLVELERVV